MNRTIEMVIEWLESNPCLVPLLMLFILIVIGVVFDFVLGVVRAITGNYPPIVLNDEKDN